MTPSQIIEALDAERRRKKLTIAQWAEKAGMLQPAVSRVLARGTAALETAQRLALAVGMELRVVRKRKR